MTVDSFKVCATCGARVENVERHAAWHARVDAVLAALEGKPAAPRPWEIPVPVTDAALLRAVHDAGYSDAVMEQGVIGCALCPEDPDGAAGDEVQGLCHELSEIVIAQGREIADKMVEHDYVSITIKGVP